MVTPTEKKFKRARRDALVKMYQQAEPGLKVSSMTSLQAAEESAPCALYKIHYLSMDDITQIVEDVADSYSVSEDRLSKAVMLESSPSSSAYNVVNKREKYGLDVPEDLRKKSGDDE